MLQDAITHSLPAYRAVSSTSIHDAKSALAELQGDLSLVCVDQRLGGPTGVDFIRELRESHPGLPSVLYTGKATPREEERARQAGATVLWKPLQLGAWLGEIKNLLVA